jgi:hypothetical protein
LKLSGQFLVQLALPVLAMAVYVFGQPKWASRKAPRESGCCAIRVVALSVPLSASEFERVTMLRLIITRRRRQSDFASWPAQQSGTSHIYIYVYSALILSKHIVRRPANNVVCAESLSISLCCSVRQLFFFFPRWNRVALFDLFHQFKLDFDTFSFMQPMALLRQHP